MMPSIRTAERVVNNSAFSVARNSYFAAAQQNPKRSHVGATAPDRGAIPLRFTLSVPPTVKLSVIAWIL